MVDRLEDDFEGELTVVSIDARDSAAAEILAALRVRGHPTLVLLSSTGDEEGRFLGPPPEAELRAAVQRVLDSP